MSKPKLDAPAHAPARRPDAHRAVGWGVVAGVLSMATPLAFWWLPAATLYAMTLALIATVYVGFAVADGRTRVVAVEATVAGAFILIAVVSVTGTPRK